MEKELKIEVESGIANEDTSIKRTEDKNINEMEESKKNDNNLISNNLSELENLKKLLEICQKN